MTFKIFLVFLSVISVVLGKVPSSTDSDSNVKVFIDSSCICPLNYDPVCSSTGRTFPNLCAFNCEKNQGEVVVRKGECEAQQLSASRLEICPCPRIYAPICGSNGKTYGNSCLLRCAMRSGVDVKILKRGPC